MGKSWTVWCLAVAGCLAFSAPRDAGAQPEIPPEEFVLGTVGAGVAALTVNVLPIIAETRRRPNGRVPAGWVATQYLGAAANYSVAGIALWGTRGGGDPSGHVAVAIPTLAVGTLWTIFAVRNTAQWARPVARTRVAQSRWDRSGLLDAVAETILNQRLERGSEQVSGRRVRREASSVLR